MLTNDQIESVALAHANKVSEPETISHTHRTISFIAGAKWANEQNAAEIAELVEMLNRAVEFVTFEDKLAAWKLLSKYGK